MKQINEMFDRFFSGRDPLKQKWQVRRSISDPFQIVVTHYHHIILIYHMGTKQVIHTWWEKPADKRGLIASLEYLIQRESADGNDTTSLQEALKELIDLPNNYQIELMI
jgi:hypothetical protein